MGIKAGVQVDVSGLIAASGHTPVQKHFIARLFQMRKLTETNTEWRFADTSKATAKGFQYCVEIKDLERNSILATGYGNSTIEATNNAAKAGLQALGCGLEAAQF